MRILNCGATDFSDGMEEPVQFFASITDYLGQTTLLTAYLYFAHAWLSVIWTSAEE
jgi:hypothetical protein